MSDERTPPPVLCLAGLDPSGGAGLAADIEAVAANGAVALPVAGCLTVQTPWRFERSVPVAAELVASQLDAALASGPVAAVKVGAVGSAAAVHALAARLPAVPGGPAVVVDPVLAASSGGALADGATARAIADVLLPVTTLATPNRAELVSLAGAEHDDEAIRWWLARGCRAVLVTGGDTQGPEVVNTLHRAGVPPLEFRWPRLAGRFHGSGCTLAAACAAWLARGADLEAAVERAQHYTWQALRAALPLGDGVWRPRRLPPVVP